jgi:hypothetical protein
MIQDSSRVVRFEVEDSMNPGRESVTYNSLFLGPPSAAVSPALFVRDAPASQINQNTSGGPATSNANVRIEIDPLHAVFPAVVIVADSAPLPKLALTAPTTCGCCDIRQPAAIAGDSPTTMSTSQ